MSERNHYRKVFKSDHLGVADIEDLIESKTPLIFTITHVTQEYGVKVAGKKGDHNIAYFKEDIKPWVLNAGNCKIMQKFAGGSPVVADWNNIMVALYINPDVKMKGEITGGVRINPTAPRLEKREITPQTAQGWKNAKAAYIRDKNFDAVLKQAHISSDNMALIVAEVEATNGVS